MTDALLSNIHLVCLRAQAGLCCLIQIKATRGTATNVWPMDGRIRRYLLNARRIFDVRPRAQIEGQEDLQRRHLVPDPGCLPILVATRPRTLDLNLRSKSQSQQLRASFSFCTTIDRQSRRHFVLLEGHQKALAGAWTEMKKSHMRVPRFGSYFQTRNEGAGSMLL